MKRISWPRQRRTTAITTAALWAVTLAIALYLAAALLVRTDSNRTTLAVIAAVLVLVMAAMTLRAMRRIPPRYTCRSAPPSPARRPSLSRRNSANLSETA